MKKKWIPFATIAAFVIAFLVANYLDHRVIPEEVDNKIRVGAPSTPHGEILNVISPQLEEQGYELEIVTYEDYELPNLDLASGSLDANFFQHEEYIKTFNYSNGTNIVPMVNVLFEPFGIYPSRETSLESLNSESIIAIPNDGVNMARALLLLEANGIIALKEGVGLSATMNDIIMNFKNVQIFPMESVQIIPIFSDVEMAILSAAGAKQAGLSVTDAVAVEDKDSLAASTYGNVIAVRFGDETSPKIIALIEAMQSDEVRDYINSTYQNYYVPTF